MELIRSQRVLLVRMGQKPPFDCAQTDIDIGFETDNRASHAHAWSPVVNISMGPMPVIALAGAWHCCSLRIVVTGRVANEFYPCLRQYPHEEMCLVLLPEPQPESMHEGRGCFQRGALAAMLTASPSF